MPEQSEQDDYWDGYAQQPKQDSSAHIFLPTFAHSVQLPLRTLLTRLAFLANYGCLLSPSRQW